MHYEIEINNRHIGADYPVYIVAELSANHNGDFDQAIKLIHAAKDSGADAVKVQTYTPDTLTIASDKKYFRIDSGTLWDGQTLYNLYKRAEMPWDWQPKLKHVANQIGLDFFSTAFDSSSVAFLEKMNVPAYKIASFEIVDIPLIKKIAKTGKPLILSTGMSSRTEIREAILAAKDAGGTQIALLKCTSAYPAPPESMNLRTIPYLAKTFGTPVGVSDHTLGIDIPIAAVALGACIVEKHLTLSRAVFGPDSAFSLEPQEFKGMVRSIRTVEKSLGQATINVNDCETGSRVFRRSLFVVQNMTAGELFTIDNVRSIRPAYGLSPKYLVKVLGRRAAIDIEVGTPLTWDLIK